MMASGNRDSVLRSMVSLSRFNGFLSLSLPKIVCLGFLLAEKYDVLRLRYEKHTLDKKSVQ